MKKILTEIAVLIVSYIAVRYLFFNMYGSKDASWLAIMPAFIGMTAAVFFNCSVTGYGTALGYIISFAASQLFRHDYIDPNRGNSRYSNYFEIWLLTYICIIAVCLLTDLLQKRKKKA
jgi:hypothetical protein